VEIVVGLSVWLLFVVAATTIGQGKGRGAEGFLWGLLLGLIGVLIIALYPPKPGFQASETPMSGTPVNSSYGDSDKRRDAILEAIRRDPTLAQDTTPDTLARLDLAVGAIEREMILLGEVEQALMHQQGDKITDPQAVAERAQFDARVAANGNSLVLGASLEKAFGVYGLAVPPLHMRDGVITLGSPAQRAGLQPGDVLMAVNDTKTGTINDLQKFMASASKGDHIFLHVRRGPHDIVLEVEL